MKDCELWQLKNSSQMLRDWSKKKKFFNIWQKFCLHNQPNFHLSSLVKSKLPTLTVSTVYNVLFVSVAVVFCKVAVKVCSCFSSGINTGLEHA